MFCIAVEASYALRQHAAKPANGKIAAFPNQIAASGGTCSRGRRPLSVFNRRAHAAEPVRTRGGQTSPV